MNKDNRIKNYTTVVPAARTQNEIETTLVAMGAGKVMKEYNGMRKVEAYTFEYQARAYRLPADVERAITILKDIPEFQRKTREEQEKQAERVMWRILKDWLDGQIALMRIGQVQLDQVMLPYMWNGKYSLYDRLKQSSFELQASVGPDTRGEEE